ncbi:helix-hairpin-helix domain-containing protein [Microbacterium sp. Mu-80]|uniref:Helix-hairpin-helix domain-containing protein n=1 Tax=Microbacterium bandirmense TaxID=3122050 RepID=A0ABU8L6E5_9MICO
MSTSRTAQAPTIGWMLGMSTWMISAFIPGSYLAWLGFLIVGIVGRRMWWTIVGVVLGALAILVHLPIWGQWQPLVAALLYIAGMLLALMANPGWLRAMWERRTGGGAQVASPATASGGSRAARRAKAREEGKREARAAQQKADRDAARKKPTRAAAKKPAAASAKEPARSPRQEPTEADRLAARAGATTAEFFAPSGQPTAPAEPVDVNTAEADALATLPGISARRARRLVKQRDAAGGFASLDAFATAAGLQPHELVRLRGAAVCSRPPRGPRQFGRRVDY